jgi:preprotein translocase subunit SecE
MFFKDVKHELKYVTWPNKDDIKEGTLVVCVMSIFIALFLSLVDFGFSNIVKFLF